MLTNFSQARGPVYKAIIFDLDGTLVDSEPIYDSAGRKFEMARGIRVSDSEAQGFTGLGLGSYLQILVERHGLRGTIPDLKRQFEEEFILEAKSSITAFAGPVEFGIAARERGLGLAVASGTAVPLIRTCMEFCRLEGLTDNLFSSQDIGLHKPNPAVFFRAADALGVKPEECLVLEDSRPGTEAALAAGMRVLAMPDPRRHAEFLPARFLAATFLETGGAMGLNPQEVISTLEALGTW